MKKNAFKSTFFILLSLSLFSNKFSAQEKISAQSPYFHLGSPAEIEAFPLKKTSADVKIINSIASVTIEQTYINEGSKAIEAIYVFPGSTQAAINALEMKIGERIIVAKIAEKNQARTDYNQAKQDGKSATLLEQHRPNVFQMNVANILPGDVIQVTLRYTEFLEPVDGEYSFIFPTVVGPRYQGIDNPSTAGESWNQNPYLKKDKAIPYEFQLTAGLHSAVPIASASCKSHDSNIQFLSKNNASIKLNKADEGNRDFILKYRLQGSKIESGVLVYPHEKESYFLALIEPPAAPKQSEITPREFVFILDISGSMNGFPMETSKKLITEMIEGLSSQDYFNIMTFAGTSMIFSEKPAIASSSEKERALKFINSRTSGGGTELLPALKRVFALPKAEGLSRSIVIATDGYVTVEKECFELIDKQSSLSNIHTFGIGSSVNRYLLEGMGKIGKGYHTVITDAKDASREANKFRKYIDTPLLTDIQISMSSNLKVDLEPSSITDLLAGRPILVCGKMDGLPSGKLSITGKNGKEKFSQTFDYSNAQISKEYEAIRMLYARKKISRLDDYTYLGKNKEQESEVLELGLKYGLLTAYTSFLAVDSEVRNKDKQFAVVNQPLPLPYHVNEQAIGYPAPALSISGSSLVKEELTYTTTRNKKDLEKNGLLRVDADCIKSVTQDEHAVSNPFVGAENKELKYFTLIFPNHKVDELPRFKNGYHDFNNYIKANMIKPSKSAHGTIVELLVDIYEQGKIIKINLLNKADAIYAKEAIRLLNNMPNWKAARYKGKSLASKIKLQISF